MLKKIYISKYYKISTTGQLWLKLQYKPFIINYCKIVKSINIFNFIEDDKNLISIK